jgi:predicted DNA-binding transcriptional regulator AlpA
MDENEDELVTVSQFADRLGVSTARVRQLVDENKVPQPERPGAKASVWRQSVVDAVLEAREGGVSVHAALAPAAASPLRRVFDGVIEFEPYPQRQTSEAHVRIWEPTGPDGVTVVVLGALHGTGGVTNRAEPIAETVRGQLLPPELDPERIAWFEYYPGRGMLGRDEVNSVVFRLGKPERRRSGWLKQRPADPAVAPLVDPSWYRCGLAALERTVGESVECYPKPAYIRPVIEAWQRSGGREVIEYEHDEYGVHTMMTNVRILDAALPPAEASGLADDLCHVLVTDAAVFLGAPPSQQPITDPADTKVFAARLVATRLTIPEQELFDRYQRHTIPSYLPATAADVVEVEPLLARARHWLDSVDPDSDTPQPELHAAITAATGTLATRLGNVDPDFELRDLPVVEPHTFDVVGPHDNSYLEQVRWSDQAGSSQRRRRLTRALTTDTTRLLRYGVDPDGHLVAYLEDPQYGGSPRFAVEWPTLKPPVKRLGDDLVLVADGDQGERPVYLRDAAGILRPMPASFTLLMGGWNFGYGGSGPGSLVHSISLLIQASDELSEDQVPREWITDQVHHSSQESLTISLADLRRRIR